MRYWFAVFALLMLLLSLAGCSGTETAIGTRPEPFDPVLRERVSRDAAFKSEESSPLLPQDRTGFRGLAYYPVDPGLRFTVRLHRYSSPKQVRLGTNTGEIRSGLRYGYFDFQVGDQACRLQAYRLEDSPGSVPYLFVPFRDATSGQETYGSGRYIDLKENTSGIYELDFNRAYNPSCAYNQEFSCPVPPEENTLKVAIRAGEKIFVFSQKH
jgi:uncharacterized protein (DUF1684 family)